MGSLDDGIEPPPTANNWFVITPSSDEDSVLEVFRASGWTVAMKIYQDIIRNGSYPVPIALRKARESEIRNGDTPDTDG